MHVCKVWLAMIIWILHVNTPTMIASHSQLHFHQHTYRTLSTLDIWHALKQIKNQVRFISRKIHTKYENSATSEAGSNIDAVLQIDLIQYPQFVDECTVIHSKLRKWHQMYQSEHVEHTKEAVTEAVNKILINIENFCRL
eukprot:100744_1